VFSKYAIERLHDGGVRLDLKGIAHEGGPHLGLERRIGAGKAVDDGLQFGRCRFRLFAGYGAPLQQEIAARGIDAHFRTALDR
jgi:hypothetical protein